MTRYIDFLRAWVGSKFLLPHIPGMSFSTRMLSIECCRSQIHGANCACHRQRDTSCPLRSLKHLLLMFLCDEMPIILPCRLENNTACLTGINVVGVRAVLPLTHPVCIDLVTYLVHVVSPYTRRRRRDGGTEEGNGNTRSACSEPLSTRLIKVFELHAFTQSCVPLTYRNNALNSEATNHRI